MIWSIIKFRLLDGSPFMLWKAQTSSRLACIGKSLLLEAKVAGGSQLNVHAPPLPPVLLPPAAPPPACPAPPDEPDFPPLPPGAPPVENPPDAAPPLCEPPLLAP